MKNFTKLLLPTLVLALFAVPAFARGGNGGGGGDQRQYHGQRGAAAGNTQRAQNNCDDSGPRSGDSAVCDNSGPGQGTPQRDGSGKALDNRGNPNATGTPLRDGSGKTTAPGKGSKDGTGNNANCPVPAGS